MSEFVIEGQHRQIQELLRENQRLQFALAETEALELQHGAVIERLSSQVEWYKVREKNLIGQIMRMIDRWWPFVHGSMASETARNLFDSAVDIIQPQQPTTKELTI